MISECKFRIEGVAPLMMHNGQLADPTNGYVREIKKFTSKRKKTDDDHANIRELEWNGGLYLDGNDHPCIPADVLLGFVVNSSKKLKLGPKAKAGIFETKPNYPLTYDGPKNVEKLFKDSRFVDVRSAKVGMARVMRTRPRFDEWSLDFELLFDSEIIDASEIRDIIVIGGQQVGLCDYRPRFGRFVVGAL